MIELIAQAKREIAWAITRKKETNKQTKNQQNHGPSSQHVVKKNLFDKRSLTVNTPITLIQQKQ